MKHTSATKRKLSQMRRGKNNPFYGRKHTPGHAWNIGAARDVYTLCEWLWPLLVIKRKEAYDVMKFLKQKYGARLDGKTH